MQEKVTIAALVPGLFVAGRQIAPGSVVELSDGAEIRTPAGPIQYREVGRTAGNAEGPTLGVYSATVRVQVRGCLPKSDVGTGFADEATAIAAGYRPCGNRMREQYKAWRASQSQG